MADETSEQPEKKKPAKRRAPKKPATAKEPAPEREEVKAEPFDADKDSGPTVDMPGPGKTSGTVKGSAALAATCHLLGLADLTVTVLLIGLIAPLVLWLVLKDTDPEIDYHGKESINFQLNMLFWSVVCVVLIPCLGFGLLLLPVLSLVELVLIIIAAVAASQGQRYRYPAIYRILQ